MGAKDFANECLNVMPNHFPVLNKGPNKWLTKSQNDKKTINPNMDSG